MVAGQPPCPAITWSIDTTGTSHQGRASIAVRRAFAEWTAVTGIPFSYVPSGGAVGVVFRVVDSRWLAYSMSGKVVIDPHVADAASSYLTEVAAHEIGHVLGLQHEGGGLMSGDSTVPTAADAALVRCPTLP